MACTQVSQHFPTALGVDDFISRMEIALRAYDFKDSNTIACSNLCRDEVTFILKQKLDAVRLLSPALAMHHLPVQQCAACRGAFVIVKLPIHAETLLYYYLFHAMSVRLVLPDVLNAALHMPKDESSTPLSTAEPSTRDSQKPALDC